MGENVTDSIVEIVVPVVFPRVDIFDEPFAGITKGLQKPVFSLEAGAPDLRIVGAREDHFHLVHLLQSKWVMGYG